MLAPCYQKMKLPVLWTNLNKNCLTLSEMNLLTICPTMNKLISKVDLKPSQLYGMPKVHGDFTDSVPLRPVNSQVGSLSTMTSNIYSLLLTGLE